MRCVQTDLIKKIEKLPHINLIEIKKLPDDTKYTAYLECSKHGKFSGKTGNILKSKNTCPKCQYTSAKDQLLSWLSERPHMTLISDYPKLHGDPIELKCTDHDFTFTTNTSNRVHGENANRPGCKYCASNKFINPFWKKFNSLSHIEILKGKPLKGSDLITFKCSTHGQGWDMTVQSFARWKHGCPLCANEASLDPASSWKESTLGGKIVKVQGYEHYALDYIQSKGVRSCDINIHGTKYVPTIKYFLGGRIRNYFPDMFIPNMNRVVEVKSLYTAGLLKRKTRLNEEVYIKLLAKRKACLEAGYDFKLLIFNDKGSRIPIPKNWYAWRRDTLVIRLNRNRK